MNTQPPLGFNSALRVLENGRASFFRSANDDLPVSYSSQIAEDDQIPQFGYVGINYERRRILLVGINPGNGPRNHRAPGDEVAMPALHKFVAKRSPGNFTAAQRAYRSICEEWFVWGQQCNDLLLAANIDAEDIAFTNALPWRTASLSRFSHYVAQKAAIHYVKPIIDELSPKIIVAVGKRAGELLQLAGRQTEAVVILNRARALKPSVIIERHAAAKKFTTLTESEI